MTPHKPNLTSKSRLTKFPYDLKFNWTYHDVASFMSWWMRSNTRSIIVTEHQYNKHYSTFIASLYVFIIHQWIIIFFFYIHIIIIFWWTISRESQTQHDDDRPHWNSIFISILFIEHNENIDDDHDWIIRIRRRKKYEIWSKKRTAFNEPELVMRDFDRFVWFWGFMEHYNLKN